MVQGTGGIVHSTGDDRAGRARLEAELLARAKTGDRRAWAALLEPVRRRLLPVVRRLVKDEREAEDLVQDTLLTMYVKMSGFRGDSLLYTWAWQVAQREALNQLRDETNHRRLLLMHTRGSAGFCMGEQPLTPEQLVIDRESLEMLTAALSRLDPETRALILQPLDDAAGELEDVKTINERVALHRARRMLRQELATLEGKENERWTSSTR